MALPTKIAIGEFLIPKRDEDSPICNISRSYAFLPPISSQLTVKGTKTQARINNNTSPVHLPSLNYISQPFTKFHMATPRPKRNLLYPRNNFPSLDDYTELDKLVVDKGKLRNASIKEINTYESSSDDDIMSYTERINSQKQMDELSWLAKQNRILRNKVKRAEEEKMKSLIRIDRPPIGFKENRFPNYPSRLRSPRVIKYYRK